ncbi:MAG: LysM domain-containing protein [Acidobacteriota bacterium]
MTKIADGMPPSPGTSLWGSGGKTLIAGRGQTMEQIAAHHDIPLGDLMKANPHIKDKGPVQAGVEIRIPEKSTEPGLDLHKGLGGGVQFERSERSIFDGPSKGFPTAGGCLAGPPGGPGGEGGDPGVATEGERTEITDGLKEDGMAAAKRNLDPSVMDAASALNSVADGTKYGNDVLEPALTDLNNAKSGGDKKVAADKLIEKVDKRVIAIDKRLTEMENDGLTDLEKAEAALLYKELASIQHALETNLQDPAVSGKLEKALNPERKNGLSPCMARIEGMIGQEILTTLK